MTATKKKNHYSPPAASLRTEQKFSCLNPELRCQDTSPLFPDAREGAVGDRSDVLLSVGEYFTVWNPI